MLMFTTLYGVRMMFLGKRHDNLQMGEKMVKIGLGITVVSVILSVCVLLTMLIDVL